MGSPARNPHRRRESMRAAAQKAWMRDSRPCIVRAWDPITEKVTWKETCGPDGYGLPVTVTRRSSRKRVQLHKSHPYANSGGWQYLLRFLAMEELGKVLRPDEHAHHADNDKTHDDPLNVEVWLAERHGRYHQRMFQLAGVASVRGPGGRWVKVLREFEEPRQTTCPGENA